MSEEYIPQAPETPDVRMNEFLTWVWRKLNGSSTVNFPIPVTQGGTGTITAFTAGSVIFAGASGVYAQDNVNFFWDDTNNRLGLGTASPTARLHLGAGGIAASSGPLKFTSGGPLTTPEAGALEYDGDLKWTGSDSARGIVHREDGFNEDTYSGANLDLGTTNDGAYADVDATNASITFTVNVPGRYVVDFEFIYQVVGNTSAAVSSQTLFKLTDGTNESYPQVFQFTIATTATGNHQCMYPVHLSHAFNFTTTGSKTVKVQKQNIISTAVSARRILTSGNGTLYMRSYRISE